MQKGMEEGLIGMLPRVKKHIIFFYLDGGELSSKKCHNSA